MAKQNFKKSDEQLENVNEALSTTGQWIEQNQNILTWIILGIVVIILGFLAIRNYVIRPNQLAASNENAKAVVYFQQQDWATALNGDDAECLGFAAIADSYKLYQQGELAALYAGICSYKLGEYEDAQQYLKRFSADDLMIDPAARILLGDTYVQLDELDKAAKTFDAASKSQNEILAPIALKKAGIVYLELGNKAAAKKCFGLIESTYPQSAEAQDIAKYIALATEK